MHNKSYREDQQLLYPDGIKTSNVKLLRIGDIRSGTHKKKQSQIVTISPTF